MTPILYLRLRFSPELQTYKRSYYLTTPPDPPWDLKLIFIHLTNNYLVPTVYPQCHFVLSTGETVMNKIDIAPCGTYIVVGRGGDK